MGLLCLCQTILKYAQKGNADLLTNRIYFGGSNNQQKTSNNLMQIQSSTTRYQVLKIDYLSSQNNKNTRSIEPFAIYSINGNFLLIAFCLMQGIVFELMLGAANIFGLVNTLY